MSILLHIYRIKTSPIYNCLNNKIHPFLLFVEPERGTTKMSTFGGRLKEDKFKFICIDNFENNNLDAEAFFLSHFHSGK